MADKILFSEWLLNKMLSATAELRTKLEESSVHPMKGRVQELVGAFGTRVSGAAIEVVKKFVEGSDMEAQMATLTMEDFSKTVAPVQFSVMSMTRNPNSHDYSTNAFLVIRNTTGYRQDGSSGNSFPSYEPGLWKPATDEKIKDLCTKYVALAKNKSTAFSEYVNTIKTFADFAIDFSELS